MKYNNICIMGIPEREEDLCEEIMTENFPKLLKEKDTYPGNTESQT